MKRQLTKTGIEREREREKEREIDRERERTHLADHVTL